MPSAKVGTTIFLDAPDAAANKGSIAAGGMSTPKAEVHVAPGTTYQAVGDILAQVMVDHYKKNGMGAKLTYVPGAITKANTGVDMTTAAEAGAHVVTLVAGGAGTPGGCCTVS